MAQESIQRRAVLYDKDGDAHYDTISAFIKSVRGSDPDAALYWLAKMLYAGEDPRFILRRLIILAGEDIGLADPMGTGRGGFRRCRPSTSSACRRAFTPSWKPRFTWRPLPNPTPPRPISKPSSASNRKASATCPAHLQDANRDAVALGHGKGYVYPHMYEDHFAPQQYLPKELLGTYFYKPSSVGYEVASGGPAGTLARSPTQGPGHHPPEEIPDLTQEQIDEMKRNIK